MPNHPPIGLAILESPRAPGSSMGHPGTCPHEPLFENPRRGTSTCVESPAGSTPGSSHRWILADRYGQTPQPLDKMPIT